MSRRFLAIGGAIVLAAVGALLLISYVQGAEDRALEGQELLEVYVVTEPIDEGATIDEVEESVELRELPRDAVVGNAIADLADLEGLVASSDIVVGEQVLLSRFETPAQAAVDTRVQVPADLLQATIAVPPERAVGGRIIPGDLVAVIASFEPFELNAVEPGDEQSLQDALDSIIVVPGEGTEDQPAGAVTLRTPNSTRIIIHKVLVTAVQVEELPVESEEGAASPVELAPTGNLLITLASPAADLEKIIFTAEHGSLWLALEDPDAPEPETDIQTRSIIYAE
ncbi:MAG TPA: RcpC/CpaB family pilus assembly protein [Acidimicrobiia bacterium]|nr:RcpC/CpaB family pilus assembly protein [Acidimicrobiia bacterium]